MFSWEIAQTPSIVHCILNFPTIKGKKNLSITEPSQ